MVLRTFFETIYSLLYDKICNSPVLLAQRRIPCPELVLASFVSANAKAMNPFRSRSRKSDEKTKTHTKSLYDYRRVHANSAPSAAALACAAGTYRRRSKFILSNERSTERLTTLEDVKTAQADPVMDATQLGAVTVMDTPTATPMNGGGEDGTGSLHQKLPERKRRDKSRKRDKKRKKASSKDRSSKPEDPNKEHFVNEVNSEEYASPDSNSPTISESRVHALIQDVQLSGSLYQWESRLKRLSVMFCCTTSFLNVFYFPQLVFAYGGMYFFIPYLLFLFLVGMPLVYLELALGQYTSLPPATLFNRMSSCFGGIGYSMTILRLCISWLLFDPKTLFNFFSSGVALGMDRGMTLTCRAMPWRDCVKPFLRCKKGETPYRDSCFNVAEMLETRQITFEQAMVIMSGSSAALREFTGPSYLENELHGVFYFSAAIIATAIYAIILMSGMRFFAKVCVVCAPIFLLILTVVTVFVYTEPGTFEAFEFWYPGDPSKLLEWRTWREAGLHVLFSMSIADGTYIMIGSMTEFKNNITRDVAFVTLFDVIVSLLSTFLVFPLMRMFGKFRFDTVVEVLLTDREKVEFLGDEWVSVMHTHLLGYFSHFRGGPLVPLFFTIGLFMVTIGPQIVAAEISLMSLYRTFPRLLSIDRTHFRHIFGVVYFCTFGLFVFATSQNTFSVFINRFLISYIAEPTVVVIAFFEITVVMYHYKFRRIMTNIRTMMGRQQRDFVGRCAFISWVIVTPVCCFVLMVAAWFPTNHLMFSVSWRIVGYALSLLIAGLVIWILVTRLLITLCQRKNVRMLFEPHRNWGPQLTDDRNRAEYDERAARVRT